MSGVFLVAAKRTPFGSFGGSLKSLSATQLGVKSTTAALESIDLDPAAVDSVYFGNVIQSSPDAAYLARHVALQSGMRESTPSLTINRLCGSGFETVILGAQSIALGESKIAACGGSENMSDAPLTVSGNDARWGVKLGKGLQMNDALWSGLTDSHAGVPMGVTAENLAKKYNITREVRGVLWTLMILYGLFCLSRRLLTTQTTTLSGMRCVCSSQSTNLGRRPRRRSVQCRIGTYRGEKSQRIQVCRHG